MAGESSRVALQVGFVSAALLAVWVAQQLAVELGSADLTALRLQTLVVVTGRVVAGWAAGMAFRLQLAPRSRPDSRLRLWLGVPLGALAAWPLVSTGLPGALQQALPGWVMELGALAPAAGVLLGLTVALSVRRSTR
jgi:hypothetical protein